MTAQFPSQKLPKKQKAELLKLCRQVIGINSTNPVGNLALAQFFARELKGLGFQVRMQKAKFYGAPQANLLARQGPKKGRPLIFNTHLDTVTTDPTAWGKTGGNPFKATIRGGRLYGLGAADTKLALACQIIALRALFPLNLKRPLVITGTYGEELGLVGVQKLIQSPWVQGGDALNSEPTQMTVALGNKGFRIFKIVGKIVGRERGEKNSQGSKVELIFSGRAAHSGTPHLGSNANIAALEWVLYNKKKVEVLSLEGGLAPNIVPPFCRVVVVCKDGQRLQGLKKWRGTITGKSQITQTLYYPGLLSFLAGVHRVIHRKKAAGESNNLGWIHFKKGNLEIHLDHRIPPGRDPEIFAQQLDKLIRDSRIRKTGKYRAEIQKSNSAFRQRKSSPIVREVSIQLKSMGLKDKHHIKPGCTEAGPLAGAGNQVVTLGPGLAYGNAHQPNEYVSIKELEAAVIFYQGFLRKICL